MVVAVKCNGNLVDQQIDMPKGTFTGLFESLLWKSKIVCSKLTQFSGSKIRVDVELHFVKLVLDT